MPPKGKPWHVVLGWPSWDADAAALDATPAPQDGESTPQPPCRAASGRVRAGRYLPGPRSRVTAPTAPCVALVPRLRIPAWNRAGLEHSAGDRVAGIECLAPRSRGSARPWPAARAPGANGGARRAGNGLADAVRPAEPIVLRANRETSCPPGCATSDLGAYGRARCAAARTVRLSMLRGSPGPRASSAIHRDLRRAARGT